MAGRQAVRVSREWVDRMTDSGVADLDAARGASPYRPVRVAQVIVETADAVSLVLEPVGDAGNFAYRPGQFLTFRLVIDGVRHVRCYSLASAPGVDAAMTVAVKRVPGGVVSNWLCDHAVAGLELETLPPSGAFTPASLDDDFLLIAGGSGITPVLSILRAALRGGNGRIALVYANRDENSVIFRDELNALARKFAGRLSVVHWLESVQGLPRADLLRAVFDPHAEREIFLCGPEAFMDSATQALAENGVARRRIHAEKFLSLSGDPGELAAIARAEQPASPGLAAELDVTIDGQTQLLEWPAGQLLLDVLLEAGISAPHSCREGKCSACTCRVIGGEVTMAHNSVLEKADIADGWVLSCQARAASPGVKITFD